MSVLDSLQSAGGLSTNWTTGNIQGDTQAMSEDASGAFSSTGTGSSSYWNLTTFNPEVEAYLTLATLPIAGAFSQVAMRVTTPPSATFTGYIMRVIASTGLFDFRIKINGAATVSLGTISHAALAAGDSFGMSCVGTTLSAYFRAAAGTWTGLGSIIDTQITGGGYITFSVPDATTRATNVGGGSMALPPYLPHRMPLGV